MVPHFTDTSSHWENQWIITISGLEESAITEHLKFEAHERQASSNIVQILKAYAKSFVHSCSI